MQTTVRNVALGIAILAILIAIALFIGWTKLSLEQPTLTPTVVPLLTAHTTSPFFTADFESSVQPGVGIYAGTWKIIDDGTGNHVFQNDSLNDWPGFSIGKPISDGVIEFRVKYLDYDLSQDNGSGRVNLVFRSRNATNNGYIFSLHPYINRAEIVYVPINGTWSDPLEGSMSTIYIQRNIWYKIRLELSGTSINTYLDDAFLSTAKDDRSGKGEVILSTGPNTKVQFDDISIEYYAP